MLTIVDEYHSGVTVKLADVSMTHVASYHFIWERSNMSKFLTY